MDIRTLLAAYPFIEEAHIVALEEAFAKGELTEDTLDGFLAECATTKTKVEEHMRREIELFGSLHQRLQQLTDTAQRDTIRFAEEVSHTSDQAAQERILRSLDI